MKRLFLPLILTISLAAAHGLEFKYEQELIHMLEHPKEYRYEQVQLLGKVTEKWIVDTINDHITNKYRLCRSDREYLGKISYMLSVVYNESVYNH